MPIAASAKMEIKFGDSPFRRPMEVSRTVSRAQWSPLEFIAGQQSDPREMKFICSGKLNSRPDLV